MIWAELCRDALQFSNLAPRGQDADPQLFQDAFKALQYLLSDYSRDGILAPAYVSTQYVLESGLSEYLMGPMGDFPDRPIDIYQVILSGSTLGQVKIPIEIRPWDEYKILTFPSAPGMPNSAYWNPTYPTATLAFYPTPNQDWTMTVWGVFPWDSISPSDTVSLPPGYDSMIVDNLACELCTNYNRAIPTQLAIRARDRLSGVIMALPTKDRAKDNQMAQVGRRLHIRNWQADTPT